MEHLLVYSTLTTAITSLGVTGNTVKQVVLCIRVEILKSR